MRERSTQLYNIDVFASQRDDINGGTVYITSHNTQGNKSILDCQTPNFFRVKRKGGVFPFLPVSIRQAQNTATPGYHDLLQVGTGKHDFGTQFLGSPYVPGLPGLPAVDTAAITYVVNAAIANAKAESFDALTFAAELDSSVSMIARRVSSINNWGARSLATALRRPGRLPDNFNNAWLEYRYGWRPLVSDISNIIEHVAESERLYNRGRSTITVDLAASNSLTTVGVGRNINYSGSRSGTRTYRGYAFAVGTFGSRPSFNLATTAWELVPYSFVVDWMLDVGSWLTAITPTPGVDISCSGYSVKDEYTDIRTWNSTNGTGAPGLVILSSTPGRYTYSAKTYNRFPYSVTSPRLFPRLNTLRSIDLVSLVSQRAIPILRRVNQR